MKTWEQMMRTKSISWFRRSFYARMIVWCFNKETITFLWKWTENGRKSSQCHNKMKGNQGWLKTFAHYHIWKFLLLEDIKFFLGMSLLKVHECFCKHPTVGPFSGKKPLPYNFPWGTLFPSTAGVPSACWGQGSSSFITMHLYSTADWSTIGYRLLCRI